MLDVLQLCRTHTREHACVYDVSVYTVMSTASERRRQVHAPVVAAGLNKDAATCKPERTQEAGDVDLLTSRRARAVRRCVEA